ncbi:MAG: helix-turn-helix transcriptional regulator [Burkholderiaceae bacterium]|nr:MAG: helix-turn-helix transcriptional regulator [Burkholderiaceae bacterium]
MFDYFTLSTISSQASDSVNNQGYVGLHAEKLREYQAHYIGQDLRMAALAQLPVGQLMLDHEHISTREMSRNIVYTDFLRPHGFQHTLGALVRDEGGSRDFVGFIRPSDHTPYGANDKALVERLMPDLTRAAHLRARTVQLARHAALGLAALDALPQALVIVDAHCHIQYSNPAADRMLARPGAMGVRHGRLSCLEGNAQVRWQSLVAAACLRQGTGMAGALQPAPGARSLVVTVLPINARHPMALHHAPLALAVLHDPAAPGDLDPRLIGEILGLSPTETRLVLLLASGKTVKDFAVVEGMSWHTARSHTKNLLRKTGCRRQMELVGLLQSLRIG